MIPCFELISFSPTLFHLLSIVTQQLTVPFLSPTFDTTSHKTLLDDSSLEQADGISVATIRRFSACVQTFFQCTTAIQKCLPETLIDDVILCIKGSPFLASHE
jgi:hypothetical protein